MTNEELNPRLYEKMPREQEGYREKLLSLSPAEILRHAYEYTVREDVLCSLENNELSSKQAKALLKSSTPLADVFQYWQNHETHYMEGIWDNIVCHADVAVRDNLEKKHREAR